MAPNRLLIPKWLTCFPILLLAIFRICQSREDFFGILPRDHCAQLLDACSLDIGNASKFLQQFLRGSRSDSGDVAEGAMCLALAPPLPVKSDREAVCLIADLLNQMQNRRMMLQDNRFVFLAQDKENFLSLRDAGHRLIDDLERFERLRRSVQLSG